MSDKGNTTGCASQGTEDGDYAEKWKAFAEDTRLLVKRTKDYIVIITKQWMLDWQTSVEYDEARAGDEAYNANTYASIDVELTYAQEVPLDGFDDDTKMSYLCMLGKATTYLLEFRYEAAEKLIQRASSSIATRRQELSRKWYIQGTLEAAAWPVGLGIAEVLGRKVVTCAVGVDGLYVTLAMCAGSLGALMSIIRRTGKIEFDPFASKELHTNEARGRVIVGCIAALLVGLCIQARIISGAWVNGDHPLLALLAIAIVAGTSEQMVTSVIQNVQTSIRPHHFIEAPPSAARRPQSRRGKPNQDKTTVL